MRGLIRKSFLLVNTIRFLKPVQVFGRIWFHATRPKLPKGFDLKPLSPKGDLLPFCLFKSIILGPKEICILNRKISLGGGLAWSRKTLPQLWLFNLHYFSFLLDETSTANKQWLNEVIGEWIEANPYSKENGWMPYPLSLRIVNWIKFFCAGSQNVEPDVIHSLTSQLDLLSRRFEYHLQGNHLFVNAKALLIGGLFFGAETGKGKEWFQQGYDVFVAQFFEQIQEDGSHFENSPMYHALILEDVLDVINFMQAYGQTIPETILNRTKKSILFLKAVSHPDGHISFFNDATLGMAHDTYTLLSYAKSLGLKVGKDAPINLLSTFSDSGFVRFEKDQKVLLIDGGPNGPEHVFSHVHADSLSFELSYAGKRILVNSGVSQYGYGPIRDYQRGTSSHNTVEIDGENQSEVWSAFRVARRAKPVLYQATNEDGVLRCKGSHSGYLRLPGKVLHTREFILKDDLEIIDLIEGHGVHQIRIFFHIHPGFQVKERGEYLSIDKEDVEVIQLFSNFLDAATILPNTWNREFGKIIPSKKIVFEIEGPLPQKISTTLRFL